MAVLFTKAFLIDDDSINNFLSKEIIESENIASEIIELTNGQEAMHYFQTFEPSSDEKLLILLDLNMPVMDGFSFLKRFYRLSPSYDFQMVILTSSDNQRDKNKLEPFYIKHFIDKPITTEKLLAIIE